jgi:Fe-S cluster assembly ATP-binding protein
MIYYKINADWITIQHYFLVHQKLKIYKVQEVIFYMSAPHLKIENLNVSIEDTEILKNFSLEIKGGEIHAIMGPNGTGKSTLASALMGHPSYEITGGSVQIDGEDLLEMEVDERARAGLFLAMQYPSEISGVTTADFLRSAINAKRGEGNEISLMKFIRGLDEKMNDLDMDESFSQRYLNEGFSGGEKKRNEILQMMMLEPRLCILDEIDSGLDIDALKVVSKGVNDLRSPERGFLIITHYQRLLNYVTPDFVHVMMQGRIVKSGGPELAQRLEEEGYDWVKEELGIKDETVGQKA